MIVLLDTCVWGGAVEVVSAEGFEVDWVGSWPTDPGDAEILRVAQGRAAVIVTLDKDFGELATVRGEPHSGIVRLVGLRAMEQGVFAVRALLRYETELRAGAIVTVERHRVRVRPGP